VSGRDSGPATRLGPRLAAVLRAGTLLAVATVAVGFILALVAGGPGSGALPLTDLIGRRDADALTSVGLLGLTLLPLGVLGVAAATFAADGERRYLLSTLVTLLLLVASLVAAALVAGAS
jgi:uncharacterized membrane protein